MPFKAIISFEDGTTLERSYRLGHLSKYMKKIRKTTIPQREMPTLPVFPWVIGLAFEDALVGPHKSDIVRIEVYRR